MLSYYSIGQAIYGEGDFLRQFGRDGVREMQIDGGKKVIKHKFAAGSTGRADVDELLRVDIMTQIAQSYAPASEDFQITQLAAVIPTTQHVQDISVLLGGGASIREWVGGRVSERLQSAKVVATSQLWEKTFEIDRTAVEDDKTGLLLRRGREIAQAVMASKQRQVIDKYVAMVTATHWLDGQFVVDTDHNYSSYSGYATNQSNKAAVTPTAVNIIAQIEARMARLDYNGNPLGANEPNVLLVGPKYWGQIKEAFNSPFFHHSGGTEAAGARGTGFNVLNGLIPTIITSAVLTGSYDDYAFLARVTPEGAPVLWVERSDVPDEYEYVFDPATSDDVRNQDKVFITYRDRHTLIFGPWHTVDGLIS